MPSANDMLKVGGENVAAGEIEAMLQSHPAVKLVQVVGIPDDRYVELPAAFVELADGASASERELIQHCRGKMASFKIPRQIRGRYAPSRCRHKKYPNSPYRKN